MSQGVVRERSVGQDGEIRNLFQGANPPGESVKQGEIYPGDQHIHAEGELTIQIHTVRVKRGDTTIADRVPAITVWVPRAMSAAWISQPTA